MQTVLHKAAMAAITGRSATEMTGTTAAAVARIGATAGTVTSAVVIALNGRSGKSAIREDDGKTTNTGAIHRSPCLRPLRRNCLPAKGS
jgi:hypothetical protein